MSQELKSFLTSLGVATSRTTAYNPQGNGQVERYNGIIWKTALLALKSRGSKTEQWEEVLPQALHSIRSLLCTATNATPHERMFNHPRRSFSGRSLPTWLTQPGPVLIKNHFRHTKYDPIVQEVELIEANPDYAYVKFPDGRESTVSIKHLAPTGDHSSEFMQSPSRMSSTPSEDAATPEVEDNQPESTGSELDKGGLPPESGASPTCERSISFSRRKRRPPAYLKDYVN